MKKNIIMISGLILIILIVLCSSILILNKIEGKGIQQSSLNKEADAISIASKEVENKDIILDLKSELNYAINIGDSSVRNKNAEYIIIGTVDSIDGGVNYNPTTKEYTAIQTIGNIKVNKIIKGNIDDEKISFIRLGGIIEFQEYEKGLNNAQKSKLETLDSISTLSVEEKANKYVSYSVNDDISIEKGKTYLMYLNYNEDYDRYGIVFVSEGLREIQETNISNARNMSSKELSTQDKQNIKVKNNRTGEYESISEVLGNY